MIKPNNYWYYEVSKTSPQYALRYLSLSWKRCFNKISGQPKFKKKGRDDSFTLDGSIPTPIPSTGGEQEGWVRLNYLELDGLKLMKFCQIRSCFFHGNDIFDVKTLFDKHYRLIFRSLYHVRLISDKKTFFSSSFFFPPDS